MNAPKSKIRRAINLIITVYLFFRFLNVDLRGFELVFIVWGLNLAIDHADNWTIFLFAGATIGATLSTLAALADFFVEKETLDK